MVHALACRNQVLQGLSSSTPHLLHHTRRLLLDHSGSQTAEAGPGAGPGAPDPLLVPVLCLLGAWVEAGRVRQQSSRWSAPQGTDGGGSWSAAWDTAGGGSLAPGAGDLQVQVEVCQQLLGVAARTLSGAAAAAETLAGSSSSSRAVAAGLSLILHTEGGRGLAQEVMSLAVLLAGAGAGAGGHQQAQQQQAGRWPGNLPPLPLPSPSSVHELLLGSQAQALLSLAQDLLLLPLGLPGPSVGKHGCEARPHSLVTLVHTAMELLATLSMVTATRAILASPYALPLHACLLAHAPAARDMGGLHGLGLCPGAPPVAAGWQGTALLSPCSRLSLAGLCDLMLLCRSPTARPLLMSLLLASLISAARSWGDVGEQQTQGQPPGVQVGLGAEVATSWREQREVLTCCLLLNGCRDTLPLVRCVWCVLSPHMCVVCARPQHVCGVCQAPTCVWCVLFPHMCPTCLEGCV